MIWLYRLLFFPAMLLASPYYLRRMIKRGGYGTNFRQRFGIVPDLPPKKQDVKRIWVQAVSVGEMLAIGPLLQALHKDSDVEIYLTTTTSTGYKLAFDRYPQLVIAIGYFPIDGWPFSARAWSLIDPDMVVITEGERWPEHIHQARRRKLPVLCVNARMSDRGYQRMLKVRHLARSLFDGITRFLPCSRQDGERLRDLGFSEDRITFVGNIKLDLNIPPLGDEQRQQLRRELGLGDSRIILGSSTWPGEERALLGALQAARLTGQQASLLLVPRHAERRHEVATLLRNSGLQYHLRSMGTAMGPIDVAVGDTTGELRKLTQLADVVFVGKSLPPHHEGQTPVEAAALGKPIIFGPEMSNFREIARELRESGGVREVSNGDELAAAVVDILQDSELSSHMATAALAWQQANQGAVARTIQIVRTDLGLAPRKDPTLQAPLASSSSSPFAAASTPQTESPFGSTENK